MAWQSSSKATNIPSGRTKLILACVLATGFLFGACGKQAVRASEKEFLADRIMQFDADGQETSADEHILSNREGSAGGRGTGGGGCGCN